MPVLTKPQEAALPGLLPFLPMLYVAWSDAVLTPTQLTAMRSQIEQHEWLTTEEQSQLLAWLDPAHPPSVAEMKGWLKQIQETAVSLNPRSRQTLSTLGLQMAGLNAPDTFRRCATPKACAGIWSMVIWPQQRPAPSAPR